MKIDCAVVVALLWVTSAVAQTSAPTTRPFAPSKETTVVVGPLRQGGTIDYVAALNELCGKGVTRENNLAVPLLEAMGRGRGGDAAAITRERAALGLVGEGGPSFVTLREF